MHILPASVRK